MKRSAMCLIATFSFLLMEAGAFGQATKDVPDIAEREIQRRGNLVERIGNGHRDDGQTVFAEAMRPPADDSHKWFITVVTTRSCRYCETLKRDFTSSADLKPFVDVDDHTQSWAHYNIFSIEDETQAWRWKGVKFGGFPTLLIQPPRSGQFGDPKTIVLQKTGYDGDAKKLADSIRTAIASYARKFAQQRQAIRVTGGMRQAPDTANGQNVIGYDPPFSPPPKVEPTPYYPAPSPYPFDVPPVPQPAPQPTVNPLSLLLSLFGGMLSSGGMTNFLLLALAALAAVRTFRKATGQKLLLDDATYQNIVDTLKKLIQPQTPKTPNASP